MENYRHLNILASVPKNILIIEEKKCLQKRKGQGGIWEELKCYFRVWVRSEEGTEFSSNLSQMWLLCHRGWIGCSWDLSKIPVNCQWSASVRQWCKKMGVIRMNSSVVSGLGTSKGTVGCDNIYIYRMWRSECGEQLLWRSRFVSWALRCLWALLCLLGLPLLWGYCFTRPRSLQILEGSQAATETLICENGSLTSNKEHEFCF